MFRATATITEEETRAPFRRRHFTISIVLAMISSSKMDSQPSFDTDSNNLEQEKQTLISGIHYV